MDIDDSFVGDEWRLHDANGLYDHVNQVLKRAGPYTPEGFAEDDDAVDGALEFLHSTCRVLVVGAGGLGCELLKDLALVGFRDIHVIDLDTIDLSNLNRQFLFRDNDIGRPKADVAAEVINMRIKGVHVTPHFGRIEDFDEDFYSGFDIVISGLDSIGARRWLSNMLVGIARPLEDDENETDPDTVIPLIDGGTEGFKGHVRVVLPRISSCIECTLSLIAPQVTFAMCTIAYTPRIPEHCIQFVVEVTWPKSHPGEKLDLDNEDHVDWVYTNSKERASEFGIEGVTRMMAQGVAKRIIPAIASTNAIVAAACAAEAFKIATNAGPRLCDFLTYSGDDGVFTHTYENARDPQCAVCASERLTPIDPSSTFESFMESLMGPEFQLKNPGVIVSRSPKQVTLFIQNPPSLRKACEENLPKRIDELVADHELLIILDPQLATGLKLRVQFTSDQKSEADN